MKILCYFKETSINSINYAMSGETLQRIYDNNTGKENLNEENLLLRKLITGKVFRLFWKI
jgi:hypothetical protein